MKLSINTDFTKMPRAGGVVRAAEAGRAGEPEPFDVAILPHDERHLRRRAITLAHGDRILVDLPEPVHLEHGDRLILVDGRQVAIVAGEEEVYDIRARSPVHLAQLCWHIGNRHLAAQIEENRVVILRDHVIKAMLEGLGATVADAVEPFTPVHGAYSGHGHGHQHDHDHGELDRHGRRPGDPHYGHNHA
ncbi:MAG: urease accessory protein UreE [Rhizobiaceae bacterium]